MEQHWNKPAVCNYAGESFTFGEMAKEIAWLHILFRQLGLKKGDKIAICGKNQARWAICFFASNTFGTVIVPILTDFTPEGIENLVNHSGCRLFLTDKDIFKKLSCEKMPGVEFVLNISDFKEIFTHSSALSEAAKETNKIFNNTYPNGFSINDVHYPTNNDKDLVVINYTSGSTGDPKGVMIRQECFSANVEYGQSAVPSTAEDNILSILPMAHMFGMAFELTYTICAGTAVYFLGKLPSPTLLVKAMKDVKPYIMIAVPMVYEKIYRNKLLPVLNKPVMKFALKIPGISTLLKRQICRSFNETFGGKVRQFIWGGAAINEEVEKGFIDLGIHVTSGYGMTEAAPLMAYENWDKFAPRSCGKAMSFVTLRIDSEDPQNIVGEIQAKGINLFSGYYNNEEATKASFTEDGWFRTGDLGVIDAQGNVFIKGRSKNMLLSANGQNIYPEEIESLIMNQEHVAESVVVQRDASKLIALVYPDQNSLENNLVNLKEYSRELLNSINARLPKYCQISKIEWVDKPFEKTPKMSIKRFLYK